MKYLIVVAHPDDEVLGAGAGIKIKPYPQGHAPVLGYIALAGHGIAEKMGKFLQFSKIYRNFAGKMEGK